MKKEILEVLNDLDKNVMFHLSLSSKELFHSNFIAYIFEKKSEIIKPILKSIGINISCEDDDVEIKREENKFDIKIIYKKSNEIVFIENKIKSLPREEQLGKYSKKIIEDKATLKYAVLLSIHDAPFFISNKEYLDTQTNISWKFLAYTDVIKILKELSIDNKTSLFYVLRDYIELLEKLYLIYGLFKSKTLFVDKETVDEFDKARIDDLYHKYVFSELNNQLENALKVKTKKILNHADNTELLNNKEFIIISDTFIRNTGVVEMKIPVYIKNKEKSLIVFGVQLHHLSFRLLIEVSDMFLKLNNELSNQLVFDKKWFDFSIFDKKRIIYRRVKEDQKSSSIKNVSYPFCHYSGNHFIYDYVIIEREILKSEIIDLFLFYYDMVLENKEDFQNRIEILMNKKQ